MKTKLGYADFTFFLTKFKYKRIDDMGIIEKAAALGLKCVQVDLSLKMPAADGAAHRKRLRQKAESAGIELIGAAYGPPTVEQFTAAVAAGKELGARASRYACGPMFVWQAALPAKELASRLAAVAPAAQSHGVALAIENHQDYTCFELADAMKTVGSDFVGVWLDTGNSLAMMEDPITTVDALAPYAHGVHLKEYVVFPAAGGFDLVGVEMGKGIVDNIAAIDILRRKSKRAEMCIAIENPLERCLIPALAPAYVAKFADRPMASLGVIARAIEASKARYPEGVVLPHESKMSEDEIIAAEDGHNRAAVEYARAVLKL